MPHTFNAGKWSSSVVQILAIFFVVFYVTGTAHVEWIHALIHDHEAVVTHSDTQETDPCHRLIYHSDVEHGCHHDSHLISTDECQMCDQVCHGDQFFISAVDFTPDKFITKQFQCYKQSLDSYWAVISSSRAPPAAA